MIISTLKSKNMISLTKKAPGYRIRVNPISEGIQNHEVLKAGAIQWPPHISGVSGPILMILDSKQGFLRSRN